MDITLNKKNGTNALIKINLTPSDYQVKVDEKIKNYSKKVNLKGFRNGKVPTAVIQKMYGKEILSEEINHLISHSLSDYIKKEELLIVGEPLPNFERQAAIDWENQKDFEFEFKVGLHSDFKYNLSKVKVNYYEIELTDKLIKETIDNLRNQFGTPIDVEISQDKDQIFGNLRSLTTDFQKEVSILLDKNKIESKSYKKLIGIQKKAQVEFDLLKAFNNDYHSLSHLLHMSEEEVKNLTGDFIFEVKDIERSTPAEMNQDFFDKIFGKDIVSGEEQFLEKVKSTIGENYKRESDLLIKKEIQVELIDQVRIELPDEFLKEYLHIINQDKFTKEQIEKEYHAYAEELRWGLVRNRIIKDAGIKIEHEEIMSAAKDLIKERYLNAGFGGLNDEILDKIIDTFLKQDEGKNYQDVAERVISTKTIDYIQQQVTVKNKKVDVEEFKKKVDQIYNKK